MKNVTGNEKVMCMCQLCLNIRLKFDAIMNKIPSKPFTSITGYFMHNVTCTKGSNGYFEYLCVKNVLIVKMLLCLFCQLKIMQWLITTNTRLKRMRYLQ